MKFPWTEVIIFSLVLALMVVATTATFLNIQKSTRLNNQEITINTLTRQKGDLEIRYGRLKEGCYWQGGWLID